MAADFVKATGSFVSIQNTTVTTAAFTGSVTAGNSILVAVTWDNTGGQLTSVDDSAGNGSYTLIGSKFTSANGQNIQHAYKLGIATGGASFTVSAHYDGAGGTYVTIIAHEVSGLLASLALDKDNGGGQATGTTGLLDVAVVPTTNGQYIFASINLDGGTATETFTSASPWTLNASSLSASGTPPLYNSNVVYYVQPTAASIQAPWTRSGTGGHVVMRTSTFKAAGGAAPQDLSPQALFADGDNVSMQATVYAEGGLAYNEIMQPIFIYVD